MTFGRWRQHARLLSALERLAHGEKILSIALDHGYASQSAFAAMFKQHFGVPPSAFYARVGGTRKEKPAWACAHAGLGLPWALPQVLSFRVAPGPLALTDSMPLSRAAALEYISLFPMVSPLVAVKMK